MAFYDEMADMATELLTEFAQGQVSITRVTPGAPDPDAPWVPVEPTTQTATLAAVVNGVSKQFIDGESVLASDLEVLFAVPAFAPELADVVTIDGRPVMPVRLIQVPAAGTPVAYKLIVRG